MDVLIIETLNGGDIVKKGNDVTTAAGWENMPYLAMFGGNVRQSTPSRRVEGELNFDFWGNAYEPDPVVQMNSQTERTLMTTALTSTGRVVIENAVKADLAFMSEFADVTVAVSIVSDDRVQIDIAIIEPTNLQNRNFRYLWDSTLGGLSVDGETGYAPPLQGVGYWFIEDDFVVN